MSHIRRASITDVARRAGVSRKSVSRVINNEANVSDALRRRIEKVISDLNYQPDVKARGLRSGKSYNIAFLYENPASYFVISLIEGIRQTCQQNGYELTIHETSARGSRLIASVLDFIERSRLDGAVLMPPLTDDEQLLAALESENIPYGRISPGTGPLQDCDVVTTNRIAGKEITAHLLDLGHREIGYISGDPEHLAMAEILTGVRECIEEFKNQGDTVTLAVAQGFNTFSSGRRAAAGLLLKSPRPTAIFAANDDMAAGAIFEAHEAGLRVPEDISIAGFDDTPVASRVWPGLTTIRQPVRRMGQQATQNLIHKIIGHDTERCAPIPTEVVFRRSTGRPPKPDKEEH